MTDGTSWRVNKGGWSNQMETSKSESKNIVLNYENIEKRNKVYTTASQTNSTYPNPTRVPNSPRVTNLVSNPSFQNDDRLYHNTLLDIPHQSKPSDSHPKPTNEIQSKQKKYFWKQAREKIIRNSEIQDILKGSTSIFNEQSMGNRVNTPTNTIKKNTMLLPKIIYAGSYRSRLNTPELCIALIRQETITISTPTPPNTGEGVSVKKKHKHKHRRESTHCRHRKAASTPEVVSQVKIDPIQLELAKNAAILTLIDYTNDKQNEVVEGGGRDEGEGNVENKNLAGLDDLDVNDMSANEGVYPSPIIIVVHEETAVEAVVQEQVKYTDLLLPTITKPLSTIELMTEKVNQEELQRHVITPETIEQPAVYLESNNVMDVALVDQDLDNAEINAVINENVVADMHIDTIDTLIFNFEKSSTSTAIQAEALEENHSDTISETPSEVLKKSVLAPPPATKQLPDLATQAPVREMLPKNFHFALFRWKYAFEAVFRQNRIRRIPAIKSSIFDYSRGGPDDELVTYRKAAIDKVERALEIVKRAPETKSKHMEVQILKFEEALKKAFPWVLKLKTAIRTHLASFAKLEYHPRGKTLIREGNAVCTVYMLVSGLCVKHKKIESGEDQAIEFIHAGEAIGETLANAVPFRPFSVTTLTRSLFVVIEKTEWMAAMRKLDNEAAKIEGLTSLPMFAKLPLKKIEMLSLASNEIRAVADTNVHEPFHEPSNLYVIIKGKCKLTLHIPFLKTIKDNSSNSPLSTSEYQVIPFYGQQIRPEKDELVHSVYTMGELGPGDSFPPIFMRDIRETYKSYTVTALEASDFLAFNIPTVNSLFPPEVINSIKMQHISIYFNDTQAREVQEHYLSTKGWRNDHGSIISYMLGIEIDREREARVARRFKLVTNPKK